MGHKLQLSDSLLQSLLELPGTTYSNLPLRAQALSAWKVTTLL